jgi:hypothetical protein
VAEIVCALCLCSAEGECDFIIYIDGRWDCISTLSNSLIIVVDNYMSLSSITISDYA